MQHQDILKKIGVILNELHDQYSFFEKNATDINDLELELFIANANFLKEHTEILRKLNGHLIKPDKTVNKAPAIKYFEPVVHKAIIQPVEKKELYLDAEVKQDDQLVEKPEDVTDATYEIPQPVIADEPITPSVQPETVLPINEPDVITPTVILNEPITEKAPTLNQAISAQLPPSLSRADNLELQPVKDLKTAINLNDKMLFVKDLFNGYSMAYSEAIEILNRFNKLEEADQFLKINYITKNNWPAKQATADKFYSLLKRRFA